MTISDVVDDQLVSPVPCAATLAPGEAVSCFAADVATAGQYANTATVSAGSIIGNLQDSDSSYYYGLIASAECSDGDVTIPARTYVSGERIYCDASLAIRTTAQQIVLVQSGAAVTYRAPEIWLQPGFQVALGGIFTVMMP